MYYSNVVRARLLSIVSHVLLCMGFGKAHDLVRAIFAYSHYSHELRTREAIILLRQLPRSRRVLARAAVGVTTKIELPFAIFCVRP